MDDNQLKYIHSRLDFIELLLLNILEFSVDPNSKESLEKKELLKQYLKEIDGNLGKLFNR